MAGLWPAGWTPDNKATAPGAAPLLLTVALPAALARAVEAARRALDPGRARRTPAHLTLFRHLPGPSFAAIEAELLTLTAGEPPAAFRLAPALVRNGIVLAPVISPVLETLREALADRWAGQLAPGDKAPPRLHITLAGTDPAPPPARPALPPGPWNAPGLLLWAHRPSAGIAEPSWTPLVACRFRR